MNKLAIKILSSLLNVNISNSTQFLKIYRKKFSLSLGENIKIGSSFKGISSTLSFNRQSLSTNLRIKTYSYEFYGVKNEIYLTIPSFNISSSYSLKFKYIVLRSNIKIFPQIKTMSSITAKYKNVKIKIRIEDPKVKISFKTYNCLISFKIPECNFNLSYTIKL